MYKVGIDYLSGAGDYTKERGQWRDDLSLGQIAAAIKGRRKPPRGGRGRS